MSTDLETTATRELASSVHALNRTVIRLETLMEQFGPIQAQQVTGLADCTNRITRQEDRMDALVKQLADEKTDRDKQLTHNRALIGICIAALGTSLALITFIIAHFK